MLHYTICYQQPNLQFINFKLRVTNIEQEKTYLQLPAWRPGRYEIQNFAQNIRSFNIENTDGKQVAFKKITKDCWEVNTQSTSSIIIHYDYLACQLDAGGTWLNEDQLYINFITCSLMVKGREHESYEVKLEIPLDYQIACPLPIRYNTLKANNFAELVDSPLITSRSLQHRTYVVSNTTFHIWMQGDYQPNWQRICSDFKKFTQTQINLFGSYPHDEYHFLIQVLSYRYYHGVEHNNATVLALGPGERLTTDLYADLLGVSCHELFHVWNVCRIKPAEMSPYDYSRENYFPTGFIAEGITTYYGDYLLARSGVFSKKTYFKELNKLLKRHFDNEGRLNLSLVDSSFDLWLDGYRKGIPGRKTSIYVKGAIVALILDLEIRQHTHNKDSLDSVMRLLWQKFGKQAKGYWLEDYIEAVNTVAQTNMQEYFDTCITGVIPLEKRLNKALNYIGCELAEKPAESITERVWGLKTINSGGGTIVDIISSESPASTALSVKDEIIAVNGMRVKNDNLDNLLTQQTERIKIALFRENRLIEKTLQACGRNYFSTYTIEEKEKINEEEKINCIQWLKFNT